ncbi:MAG TPA: helix-turn-helix domain-containing protein [Clostridiales bacterium]|nr:helix-turn-helix domain-containing protein [Clostridiales bacterium]
MNQVKTGTFIKKLRNEKSLTQEQLAEQFSVSRRTVSRWETGSNMPDLDILIEMADYFDVDLRELLDGERRSERMNEELRETVLKVADYSNAEKERITKNVRAFFVVGIIALLANAVLNWITLPSTFWVGFIKGATFGLVLVAMVYGLVYTSGYMYKLAAAKRRLIGRE